MWEIVVMLNIFLSTRHFLPPKVELLNMLKAAAAAANF